MIKILLRLILKLETVALFNHQAKTCENLIKIVLNAKNAKHYKHFYLFGYQRSYNIFYK